MGTYTLRKIIRRLPGLVIKLVPIPEPAIVEGCGARERTGEICKARGLKRALLVTDSTLKSLGYDEKVVESLRGAGVACTVFDGICSEPTCDIIEQGRKMALEAGADCIIGLGGGSVMDACKMIAASYKFKSAAVRHLLLKFLFVPGKTLPVINIPSTAGTGAEMTVGAVISSGRRKSSTVIVGLDITDVILDSELSLKMPPRITAACGIDALSHGLEGLVASVKSSEEDIRKSRECVRLVLENLPKVLADPSDVQARQNMCLAANYGGNAINRQLAGYVHAFAHSIGARYHIPHGNAIAMCLLPVLEAEIPYCDGKLEAGAHYCADGQAPGVLEEVKKLLELCGFASQKNTPHESAPHGTIPQEDFAVLTKMINLDSINYSAPVTFTNAQIAEILHKI